MKEFLNKIYEIETLLEQVGKWKAQGKKVVFTNGCFDLLHLGHLQTLSRARALGNHLIVGLNNDASVRRLKGAERPVKDQDNRAALLAALSMVDAVILFAEDTPLVLIEQLLPDVLCKGGDWKPEQIVGADVVMANGGEVVALPFLPDHSTTALANKIKGSGSGV